MHGEAERSLAPRITWVVLHLGQVALAGWILLGGGYEALGRLAGAGWTAGDPGRRVALLACGALLWLRMTYGVLVLVTRRFSWGEAAPVTLASAVYQLGFALLGAGEAARLGTADAAALLLVAMGSALNTGAELQRRAFKAHPEHRGHLCTGGFFALARHPNYLGDVIWGVGWALLTRSPWAWLIVAVEVAGFVFSQVPTLDRYLERRYGDEYRAWAGRTARLFPFIW
jgi:protein-S-isoprenylcysteine O-methyltransferase Ste14